MKIFALCFEDLLGPSGGMGVHCRDLYQELGALGHEITALSVGNSEPLHGECRPYPGVRMLKIYQSSAWSSDHALHWHFLFEQAFLANALERYAYEKFDLIHLHDSHLWSVAAALQGMWRIPIVMTSHLSPFLHGQRFWGGALSEYKTVLEGTALCQVQKVIAVSRSYQRELRESLLGTESTVIHNGVDLAPMRAVPEDSTTFERLGLPSDRPLVTFVGRLTEQKGVDLFLDVSKLVPEAQFVVISSVIGKPRQYPLYRRLTESPQVSFLNHISREDTVRVMRSSRVGCVPSSYEPFGIVALEWLGLGIPLVVSRVGGLVEFCDDGNSWLAEPTVDGMTNAIRSALTGDPWKVASGIQTAEGFTWRKAAEKTIRVYEEVLKCQSNARP